MNASHDLLFQVFDAARRAGMVRRQAFTAKDQFICGAVTVEQDRDGSLTLVTPAGRVSSAAELRDAVTQYRPVLEPQLHALSTAGR